MPTPETSSQSQKTRLAAAIAKGVSIGEWAKANNVPRRTAYRWANEARVRARIAQGRKRELDRAVGAMSESVHWAAGQIRGLAMSAASESVRLAALKLIFSNMFEISEFADLQHRIAQLEARHARAFVAQKSAVGSGARQDITN
jgi:hypothetical protein